MRTHAPRFRMDNTDGYSPTDLDELNRRFEEAAIAEMGEFDDSDPEFDPLAYGSTLDYIAEQVLADFDAEKANA